MSATGMLVEGIEQHGFALLRDLFVWRVRRGLSVVIVVGQSPAPRLFELGFREWDIGNFYKDGAQWCRSDGHHYTEDEVLELVRGAAGFLRDSAPDLSSPDGVES